MSRRSILRAAAAVVGLLSLAAGAQVRATSDAGGASAADLNNRGFAEYKAGHTPDAEKLFRAAVQKDPRHKLANYNLACVLALLWTKPEDPCQEDPALDRVFEQLKRAAQIDEAVDRKARKDRDFEKLRKLSGFWEALGATPHDPDAVKALVTGTKWMTGNESISKLSFTSVGRYTYAPSKGQKETGSYQIGTDGTIQLSSDKGRVTTAKLQENWDLEWIDGQEATFSPGDGPVRVCP